MDRLQNRKWKLSSSTTRIHPSRSEPVLKSMSKNRSVSGGDTGGEGGAETTMKDAFQLLSLSIENKQSPRGTGEGEHIWPVAVIHKALGVGSSCLGWIKYSKYSWTIRES